MEKKDKKMTTLVRDIDMSIWRKFRKKCLNLDVSANEMIKRLIREFVKK
jgi:hypothetical protein